MLRNLFLIACLIIPGISHAWLIYDISFSTISTPETRALGGFASCYEWQSSGATGETTNNYCTSLTGVLTLSDEGVYESFTYWLDGGQVYSFSPSRPDVTITQFSLEPGHERVSLSSQWSFLGFGSNPDDGLFGGGLYFEDFWSIDDMSYQNGFYGDGPETFTIALREPAAVPIPGALVLFLTGLGAMLLRRGKPQSLSIAS